MKTNKTTDTPGTEPATALAVLPVADAAPTPTPENTPLPGGGSWRWDIARPGWVDANALPDAAAE